MENEMSSSLQALEPSIALPLAVEEGGTFSVNMGGAIVVLTINQHTN